MEDMRHPGHAEGWSQGRGKVRRTSPGKPAWPLPPAPITGPVRGVARDPHRHPGALPGPCADVGSTTGVLLVLRTPGWVPERLQAPLAYPAAGVPLTWVRRSCSAVRAIGTDAWRGGAACREEVQGYSRCPERLANRTKRLAGRTVHIARARTTATGGPLLPAPGRAIDAGQTDVAVSSARGGAGRALAAVTGRCCPEPAGTRYGAATPVADRATDVAQPGAGAQAAGSRLAGSPITGRAVGHVHALLPVALFLADRAWSASTLAEVLALLARPGSGDTETQHRGQGERGTTGGGPGNKT